jgi:hypothetical protein
MASRRQFEAVGQGRPSRLARGDAFNRTCIIVKTLVDRCQALMLRGLFASSGSVQNQASEADQVGSRPHQAANDRVRYAPFRRLSRLPPHVATPCAAWPEKVLSVVKHSFINPVHQMMHTT